MTGGVLDPIIRAGLFAQVIMLVLLLASVVSWAVVIRKARTLSRAKRQTNRLLNSFGHRGQLSNYEVVAGQLRESPLSSLLLAGVSEWKALKQRLGSAPDQAGLLQELIPNITDSMQRAASRETDRLEGWLPFLAITTSVAPFLGLLGTVQGVLMSFLAIRGEELVTLQKIAPGISDALITTVVGLVVAIPAATFYNYFAARVRDLNSEMERFTSLLTGMFRIEIVTSRLGQAQSDKRVE